MINYLRLTIFSLLALLAASNFYEAPESIQNKKIKATDISEIINIMVSGGK